MRSAEGSAERLAETLATWPTWHDVSAHEGERVPFFKRAQIAAADLTSPGIAPAEDLERLTLFADNLVPHVLRLDGVLEFDERLVGRIDDGLLLEHGSPEEVEIRACALHAVELLVAARGDTRRRWSTTCCGTAARCRAIRRGRGTGRGRRRTEPTSMKNPLPTAALADPRCSRWRCGSATSRPRRTTCWSTTRSTTTAPRGRSRRATASRTRAPGRETAFRPPAYPVLLAGVYKVAGVAATRGEHDRVARRAASSGILIAR